MTYHGSTPRSDPQQPRAGPPGSFPPTGFSVFFKRLKPEEKKKPS